MRSNQQLEGFAVITGAASGIGKEAAFTFAESGVAGIVFADINLESCETAAQESRKFAVHPEYKVLSLKVDVSDEASVNDLIKVAHTKLGSIDYLVHCAGVGPASLDGIQDVTTAEFDRVTGVNQRGTFYIIRAVSKVMLSQPERSIAHRNGERSLGRGSIVVVASGFGLIGMAGNLSYCTSKHAVLGLIKSAAFDLVKQGIRVNAICPGFVDTPMINTADPIFKGLAVANPFGRPAKADEIADAILYLAGPNATYITATILSVDAGALNGFVLPE